ncbi:MAG: ABC transporter ATP-binding protein/permease [Clostridiales bacterium]|nr:ABC transporter ATP-binding protein/permease [Clostridiales bacterium]
MRKKAEKKTRAQRREDKQVILRIVREARPIYGWLVLASLISCVIITCAVMSPKILGSCVQLLYDFWAGTFQGSSLTRALLPGCCVLAAVYLLQSGMNYLKMFLLNNVVSRYFTCALRIRMSDKISRLPVRYIDNTPAGQILERMNDDVSHLGGSIHDIVDTLTVGFLQIITLSVVMLLEDWRLALIVLIFMPLSIWLSARISSLSEKHFDQMFEESGKLYSVVEESYANYQTSKAYNFEEDTIRAHQEVNKRQQKAETTANFLGAMVRPCITFTNALAYIIINVVGGVLIVNYGVSVGVVVTIVLFAKQFSAPLEQIAQGLSSMQRTKAAAKRVFEVLDEPEEQPLTGHLPQTVRGDVRFAHVDFSYDKERPLIRDLNIDVKQGQKVAIVGPTGAGKTTIVNLLMRFYDIDGGKIFIDGQDVSDVSRDELRTLFGMVLQDTWLFSGSIADNVAYGRPGASREEIIKACDEAYCHHFIRTLPQGYDTQVSEDTVSISGGQKQLLTIARALLADRRLLILDEATSNVDTRTEILIQKAMDKLMRGKTCFVIAHRLSTIVDADLILVLRDGQIVETGKHRELLDKKGFYYQLYTSQYAI